MSKIREVHIALDCCQPLDPIAHFTACECGQLMFFDKRSEKWEKNYDFLETSVACIEQMMRENPTVFARVIKVHRFRLMPKLPDWCYVEEEE